ncbi:MAG TPA: MFS transporter [Acidimicrobiales bacterium]|nr:MFS transporter [Acidimicrobiales bacterium]
MFGWRGPFLLTALPLLLAIGAAKVLPNDRPEVTASFSRQLAAARGQVRRPEVKFLLLIAFMGFVMFFGASVTALPLHLEQQYDARAAVRGLILASPAASSVCMALLLGRIAGRYSTGFLTACGFAIYSVLTITCGLTPTLLLAALPVIFIGLGEVLITIPLQGTHHGDLAAGPTRRGRRGVGDLGATRSTHGTAGGRCRSPLRRYTRVVVWLRSMGRVDLRDRARPQAATR